MSEFGRTKDVILRQIEYCTAELDGAAKKMNLSDSEYLDHLTHAYKNLVSAEVMEAGEPEHSSSARGSYEGYSQRRDNMGRYSSAEEEEQMLDMVERMSKGMSGEKKRAAQQFLREMQRY